MVKRVSVSPQAHWDEKITETGRVSGPASSIFRKSRPSGARSGEKTRKNELKTSKEKKKGGATRGGGESPRRQTFPWRSQMITREKK